MIRLVQMGNQWFGVKIDRIDAQEVENIEAFVDNRELVVLCQDLLDAKERLGIDDVEMVT